MAPHRLHESARREPLALGIVFSYPFANPSLVCLFVRVRQANRLHLDPVGFGCEPRTITVLFSAKSRIEAIRIKTAQQTFGLL